MIFSGTYFDGTDVVGRGVQVEVSEALTLSLRGEAIALDVPSGQYALKPALGRISRFAALPSGRLELPWCEGLNEAFAQVDGSSRAFSRTERWFEIQIGVTLSVAATLVAAVAVLVFVGLPRMSRRLAFAVPVALESAAGRASEAALTRISRGEAAGEYQKGRVEEQLKVLSQVRPLHLKPRLLFVAIPQPNAFALPGGVIVVTQGLLNLNLTDDEIAAILAHELGHEELRHGLQSILRNSSALVVVSAVTGDLSTLVTFSGSLPALLLTRGYSRQFEREADEYGVALLNATGIDPNALASALEKLDKAAGQNKTATASYLSTHPNTRERIALIRASALKSPKITDNSELLGRATAELTSEHYDEAVMAFKRAFKVKAAERDDLNRAIAAASMDHDVDSAFAWLGVGAENGWNNRGQLEADDRLANVRHDPRWMVFSDNLRLTEANKAVQTDPRDFHALLSRGLAYVSLHKPDLALADFNAAIEVDSSKPAAFFFRADCSKQMRRFDEAIADYGKAIALLPGYSAAYFNRGVLFLHLSKDEAAMADFDQAIRFDAKFTKAYLNRGIIWQRRKEYTKAKAEFAEAIAISPSFSGAYDRRGYVDEHLGDYGGARADFDRALELAPSSATANNSLAWFLSTAPTDGLRDGHRAVDCARKACELSQWVRPSYIDTLAAAYAERGDFHEALDWERKFIAAEVSPEKRAAGEERMKLYMAGRPFRDVLGSASGESRTAQPLPAD